MLYMVQDDRVYVTKLVHQKENREDEIHAEVLAEAHRRLEELRSGKVTPGLVRALLVELERGEPVAPRSVGCPPQKDAVLANPDPS
jgi:hypothetical protein